VNQFLRIYEFGRSEFRVEHTRTAKVVARFKTWLAAAKFGEEISGFDWDFDDATKTPPATWSGVRAALERRGVKV
jgi:hypothetical protein